MWLRSDTLPSFCRSSIKLSRGIHTLKLRLRTKGSIAFTYTIKLLETKQTFQVLSPSFLPDLVDGKLFSTFISIPINNLHSSNWLKVTKVSTVKESSSNPQFSVRLTAEDKAFAIAPGQVRPIKVILEYKNGKQYNLGRNKEEAHQQVHELMAERPARAARGSVAELLDAFII